MVLVHNGFQIRLISLIQSNITKVIETKSMASIENQLTFTLEEAKTIKVRVWNPNDEPLYFGGSGGKLSGCLEKQDGTDWQAVKTDRAVFPDLAQLGGGEEKEFVIDTAGTILAPGSYRFVVPWQTAAENEKERRDSFLGTAADPGSYSHDAFFCFSVTA